MVPCEEIRLEAKSMNTESQYEVVHPLRSEKIETWHQSPCLGESCCGCLWGTIEDGHVRHNHTVIVDGDNALDVGERHNFYILSDASTRIHVGKWTDNGVIFLRDYYILPPPRAW